MFYVCINTVNARERRLDQTLIKVAFIFSSINI